MRRWAVEVFEDSNLLVSAGKTPLKPNPQKGDEEIRAGCK
jgi:hypothetical protein